MRPPRQVVGQPQCFPEEEASLEVGMQPCQGGRVSDSPSLPLSSGTDGNAAGGCSSELTDGEHHSAHWQQEQLHAVPEDKGGEGRPLAPPP